MNSEGQYNLKRGITKTRRYSVMKLDLLLVLYSISRGLLILISITQTDKIALTKKGPGKSQTKEERRRRGEERRRRKGRGGREKRWE